MAKQATSRNRRSWFSHINEQLRISNLDVAFELSMTAEERDRHRKVLRIASLERFAAATEVADRKLLDRATAILTPEQSTALADWKQQELDQQHALTQAQRKALGIAPDEKLNVREDEVLPSPPISKHLRLTVDLTVDDTQVVKQLTSFRGSTVSFDAPEGLAVEMRPHMYEGGLSTETKFYEKLRSGKLRLIGSIDCPVQLIEAGKASTTGGTASLRLPSRKGYAIHLKVSGAYL